MKNASIYWKIGGKKIVHISIFSQVPLGISTAAFSLQICSRKSQVYLIFAGRAIETRGGFLRSKTQALAHGPTGLPSTGAPRGQLHKCHLGPSALAEGRHSSHNLPTAHLLLVQNQTAIACLPAQLLNLFFVKDIGSKENYSHPEDTRQCRSCYFLFILPTGF